jgi:cobalt/nickel transport system permease protein
MGLVTVVVGYAVFRGIVKILPYGRSTTVASAFVAAAVSVPVSALALRRFFAIGGTADVTIGKSPPPWSAFMCSSASAKR